MSALTLAGHQRMGEAASLGGVLDPLDYEFACGHAIPTNNETL